MSIASLLVDSAFVGSIPRFAAPIVLAGLGGALCRRVGVFNVALEAMMLAGAFAAVAASYAAGSALSGVAMAALAGALVGALFAIAAVWKRGDAIVVGIALNILISAATSFALRAVFGVRGSFDDPRIAALPRLDAPLLADVPGVGPLFAGQTALVWLAALAVAVVHVFLSRHPLGIRWRGVGEHPVAARSLGVSVGRTQAAALVVCGLLCGLAGAQLAIGTVSLFVENMTAGRGWIAVVVVLLGAARPVLVAALAVLFGVVDAVGFRLQGLGLPQQFTEMLPYVVTLTALAASGWRRRGGRSRWRTRRSPESSER
ncbi:MAG TPA: ABC transporter permease [Haliangium sp.]|nr:ABC transporter permease [Haliangium sp.]